MATPWEFLRKFRSCKEKNEIAAILALITALYRVVNCCLFFYYIDCVSNGPFAKQVGDITFNQEDFRLNIDIDAVQWPHGKGIPADSPECGFDGLGCVVPSTEITPTTPDDNSKIGRLFLQ